MAGTSGKAITQKLGIKPGFCIFVSGAPKAYDEIVGDLPDGARIILRLKAPLDMVHLFATRAAGLADKLSTCRKAIAPDGMIWVSWPKKSSGVASDLSDIVVREVALPLGLVDIKVCAVDEVWSGLKFVIPKDLRANNGAPKAARGQAPRRGKVRSS
jgi:hypothetical protein